MTWITLGEKGLVMESTICRCSAGRCGFLRVDIVGAELESLDFHEHCGSALFAVDLRLARRDCPGHVDSSGTMRTPPSSYGAAVATAHRGRGSGPIMHASAIGPRQQSRPPPRRSELN
jgi:hypothetical protein